jgi:hypothetical protein
MESRISVRNAGEQVTGRPPLSREGIDGALARLRDERDRIATALLDLENHPGYQLLKGAPLTGETKLRWDEIQARVSTLWGLFDAYRRQLELAEEIRARQSRPSQERLAELTGLLTGPSVEPPGGEIPLERRSLLGPAKERLTLDAVVVRMTALYDGAADAVAATDAVWSVLLDRLGEVEEAFRAAQNVLAAMETGDPELDRIGRDLAGLRAAVVGDPLSLRQGGRADTRRLDAAGDQLTAVRRRLEEALRMRAEHGPRMQAVEASIRQLQAAEDDARLARDVVLVKIASPRLPELPAQAQVLAQRLPGLAALRDQGRWPELSAAVGGLERAAEAALDQARTAHRAIAGLLERRDELRGRLDAYRAKAGRLGRAEDLALDGLYTQARELLFTAPCDLRRATVALAAYQRAITSPEAGAGT